MTNSQDITKGKLTVKFLDEELETLNTAIAEPNHRKDKLLGLNTSSYAAAVQANRAVTFGIGFKLIKKH